MTSNNDYYFMRIIFNCYVFLPKNNLQFFVERLTSEEEVLHQFEINSKTENGNNPEQVKSS
jgi:hypothetical protein